MWNRKRALPSTSKVLFLVALSFDATIIALAFCGRAPSRGNEEILHDSALGIRAGAHSERPGLHPLSRPAVRRPNDQTPVLAIALSAEQPRSPRRLEHEYSLAAELDSAWAAEPLALTRNEGLITLTDPGGGPLGKVQ